MRVEVKAFATLREVMDQKVSLEIPDGASAGDLIERLCASWPGLFEMLFESHGILRKYVNILVNGRNIHFMEGLKTPLSEGDTVALFPPAGGG